MARADVAGTDIPSPAGLDVSLASGEWTAIGADGVAIKTGVPFIVQNDTVGSINLVIVAADTLMNGAATIPNVTLQAMAADEIRFFPQLPTEGFAHGTKFWLNGSGLKLIVLNV